MQMARSSLESLRISSSSSTRWRTTSRHAESGQPTHGGEIGICLLRNVMASMSMKRGAVMAQGKPRKSKVVENVG
jgi:hypothetical protein